MTRQRFEEPAPAIRGTSLPERAWYYWRRSRWMLDPRRFSPRYSRIAPQRPIFLLGNQGDGLTLISRVLRRHRQVVSVTGNHEYWSGADELQNVMRLRLPPSLAQPRRSRGFDFPREMHPPHSWSYASPALIESYRQRAVDTDPRSRRALRRIIGESVELYGQTPEKARFIDKSQIFTLKAGFLAKLLEDSQPLFLLVTRNPYATCLRAASGKAGDMRRYADRLSFAERLEICAQHWSGAIEAVLEDLEGSPNLRIQSFERFLDEPETELRGLLTFLELSAQEDLLPASHHRLPFGSRFRDRWYPLRRNLNERYLSSLDPESLATVEFHCGRRAAELGYAAPGSAIR